MRSSRHDRLTRTIPLSRRAIGRMPARQSALPKELHMRGMHPVGLAVATVCVALFLSSTSDAQVFRLTKDELIALSAQNPFERFPDGRPKVPDDLIQRARGLSAEEIWAVLPGKGFPNQYEDGFELLHPGTKLVGCAFT